IWRWKTCMSGQSLAVSEIKMFLHKILLKYNVRTDNEAIGPKGKYLGPFLAPIN
ncbi:5973_t:CDS:1, partial [Gigaspora rosea]